MMDKHETTADVIAAMRDEGRTGESSCLEWVGAKMRHYADRIEAAHKREAVTDCNQFGDAAKLREALEMVRDAHYTKEVEGELCEGFEVEADDGTGRPLICVVKDALAAPPRNCDRFATLDEARAAHEAICEKYVKCHNGFPLNNEDHYSAFDCFEAWLFAPATEKEGGAK